MAIAKVSLPASAFYQFPPCHPSAMYQGHDCYTMEKWNANHAASKCKICQRLKTNQRSATVILKSPFNQNSLKFAWVFLQNSKSMKFAVITKLEQQSINEMSNWHWIVWSSHWSQTNKEKWTSFGRSYCLRNQDMKSTPIRVVPFSLSLLIL